ncbi:TetR/AcrR family transcriptional regulator [Streptomyces gossypii]
MTSAHAHPVAAPKLGLRERKKIQTRDAIRQAAYRLFAAQGYDATPVGQIAETAEVSPSTVFRYFPTKEDIVLTDEYDPVIAAELRSRPCDEPPVTALRHALCTVMAEMYEVEGCETIQRLNLIHDVPAIRARMTEHGAVTSKLLTRVLSERTGRPVDDLELRVVTGAAMGALTEAFYHWVENGTPDGMAELVDNALRVLERGLTL